MGKSSEIRFERKRSIFFYDNFSVPREDALLAALHTRIKIQKFSNFLFREFLFPVEL